MMQFGHRRSWLGAGLLAVLALGACVEPGRIGPDAEISRVPEPKDFAVIEATARRAVFLSRGQRIVVEPAPGYCLNQGSLSVTGNAAFVLIADCMPDLQAVAARPLRTVPAILTVAVSGAPGYGLQPAAFDAFEELLGAGAGLALLGRGNASAPGKIIATRRLGEALYVLIEEPAASRSPLLAPRFWRAFIEVNERLVLVTVSSFSDRPMAEDAMLGFLAWQMTHLRRANGLAANREEVEIARQMAARPDPARAPMPRQRVASAGFQGGAGSGVPAPVRAPTAPRRPG